jgi:SAM-dependent methyltransferase
LAILPATRLSAWFDTPGGARVLAEEAGVLVTAVRRAHGDTLLWLGCHHVLRDTLRGCMVRNRLYGTAASGAPALEVPRLQCAYEALPIPNNSLDALVLHHALETADDPRSVLREAARTLAPGGRIIVCAFNPVSLWGLRRMYARLVKDPFQGLHLLSTPRLLDWLAVLGFEMQEAPRYLQFGLPFRLDRVDPGDASAASARKVATDDMPPRASWRRGLPIGGVYLLCATKQAAGVRPLWRPAERRAPVVPYGRPAFGHGPVGRDNVFTLRLPRDER